MGLKESTISIVGVNGINHSSTINPKEKNMIENTEYQP